jgi:5-oxoprolinase (ATP-hydrolysing)
MPQPYRYQIWIDRGGTFTDCIAHRLGDGRVTVAKVPSSEPALAAVRAVLAPEDQDPIPPCDIRMGTTLATNALLERKGVPCGLVTTRGLGDLLAIGTQARPELFDLHIRPPSVLYAQVEEVAGRVDAHGRELEPLDEAQARASLSRLRRAGLTSVAVVLVHAVRAPEMEVRVGELARDEGFEHVGLSHEVAAERGMVGRGDTTVLDAYLTPLLRKYLKELLDELPGSRLRIMQSGGGLTDAMRFRGRDAILSGPAAGVVAAAHVARRAGLERAIGFDMGGTSTDVSRWAGELERVYETRVSGVHIRAPMLAIHTVAAGGGSLCRFDGRRVTVGPDSAGSVPGPLCYGHPDAREPTLTDVACVLGRVVPDRFPIPLHADRPRAALDALAERVSRAGSPMSREEVAEGFLRVAVEGMAEAIRRVSIARGHDVRDHGLVVFGGAGGQYACRLARRLGIRHLVFHPFAGVLSAFGMGIAPVTWHGEADAGGAELRAGASATCTPLLDALEGEGRAALHGEGLGARQLVAERRVDLRYRGTETALTLPMADSDSLRVAFEQEHQRRFGYWREGHPIEMVTVRVEVVAPGPVQTLAGGAQSERRPERTAPLYLDGAFREVPVLHREEVPVGQSCAGPLLVLEETGTLVVEDGFELTCDAEGVIHVRASGDSAMDTEEPVVAERPDPVLLEVFNHRFMSIAEQMGIVLQRTALSTNIRERMDFSCALFDPDGGLVANAPHIPVHLGAMGESVRAVLRAHPNPQPGDVYATNDPALGGSHLPDITVVSPVHAADGRLAFVVASRGHHADVGGITPGSMPPFSSTLAEEGVVFRALRIVRGGVLDEAAVRAVLEGGSHPARRPDENVADLQAQVAANRKGMELLAELVERHGEPTVVRYMGHVQDDAAQAVEEAIAELGDGEHVFEDAMDDGTPLRVSLQVRGRRMRVDFTGTGPQVAGNLNAPRAVTVAAVLYVLRSLVGRPIPLNGGCLAPVELVVPEGSLLAPEPGRAVAGGNVETSQRIVDVLLAAVGKLAASQGTMNNWSVGDPSFGYYETVGGGAGAGPGFDGASGVHTHMTNSRITDPEILESRLPLRVTRFALRRGSGGSGRHRGGDGLVREVEFLAPLEVSILSERRVRAPFGLAGGEPGARGINRLDGQDVGGKAHLRVRPGQRLCMETPGGGGFGRA